MVNILAVETSTKICKSTDHVRLLSATQSLRQFWYLTLIHRNSLSTLLFSRQEQQNDLLDMLMS